MTQRRHDVTKNSVQYYLEYKGWKEKQEIPETANRGKRRDAKLGA
jgi:hypothetical protein